MNSTPPGELTERLCTGAIHWQVSPEWSAALLDHAGLRWGQWEREGRATPVKSGPHRTVTYVQTERGGVYVKHYRTPDWRSVALNLLRGTRAELELRAVRAIAAAGIPTFEPLAIGCRRRGGCMFDSFLVSREIPDATPLDEFVLRQLPRLDARAQARSRHALARLLGDLSAQLHNAGLMHRDYHAGNLLVSRDAATAEFKLWLIDLHAVALSGKQFSEAAVRANLLQLHPFFARRITRAERFRFLSAYWSGRRLSLQAFADALAPETVRAWSEELARDEIRSRRKRDRKWERGNRRLIIANGNQAECRGLSILTETQLHDIRDQPEWLAAEGRLRYHLRRGPERSSAAILLATSDGTCRCVVQSTRRPMSALRWSLRRRRWTEGRRAWEHGFAMHRRGIPTPRPLLFVDRWIEGQLVSDVVYEQIPQAVSLEALLQSPRAPLRSETLDRLALKVADLVGMLVRLGFVHRRLSMRTLLIEGNAASGKLWIVDPHEVERTRPATARQFARMLAPLEASARGTRGLSPRQRVLFLKRLLERAGVSHSWKEIWRRTAPRVHAVCEREPRTSSVVVPLNPWVGSAAGLRRSA